MIFEVIGRLQEESDLAPSDIFVGGFSQGAMLATDVALHMETGPGGLIVWSGTLLCEDLWRELAAKRSAMKVVQSHGRLDPLLPFAAAEWLRDMFLENGFDVEFLPFNGPHTISMEALAAAARLLHR